VRKLIFITIVFTFLTAPVFGAPHGTYSDYGRMDYSRIGGYYGGNGGEFTLRQDGIGLGGVVDFLSNSAYADVAKSEDGDVTSFQTFCVELTEYVSQPLDLYVSEQNAALTGTGSHAYQGGIPLTGDDLDPRTAYLYTQFATGQLSGYNWTVATGRASSAVTLQRLIWNIEGEDGKVLGDFSGSVGGIDLTDTQETQATAWLTEAKDMGWTGIGNVRILQAYTTSGGLAQDQLYLVPVPAAVLLGLLGLGAAGMKLRKFV